MLATSSGRSLQFDDIFPDWMACVPAGERPLYIEMIGPSGVGKSSVLRLVADGLPGRVVYFRSGFRKRQWQNLGNSLLSWRQARRLIEFYRYLCQKGVPGNLALRRAAAVTGMAADRSLAGKGNAVLLVEEGPVLYLSSCGGFGDAWKDWLHLFLPDDPKVQTFFVLLKASPEELERRRRRRGRPVKIRQSPKGTEGITPELQAQAGCYWVPHLAAAGAHCIEVDTEDRSVEEVAQAILTFVQSPMPEVAPVDPDPAPQWLPIGV